VEKQKGAKMTTTSFTQLEVWQKMRLLTRTIYRLTEYFPRHQQFTLTSQMQRAVLSIGANIAEGYGRRSPRDKAHFYTVSKGSSEELQHYLSSPRIRAIAGRTRS
jgi:four helix bundle protein